MERHSEMRVGGAGEGKRKQEGWGKTRGETDCSQPFIPGPLGPYSMKACPYFPDGKPVEVDPHHILIEDPDGSCTLILDNLTGIDSGQYMCFAASAAGSASTLGKILVQGEQRGLSSVTDTVHSQWYRPCPEYRLW